MAEETTPSPEYLKGFNEGYVIAKESPDLAEKLLNAKGDGERLKGFQDGHKQFVIEKAKGNRPSWLKENITQKQQLRDRSKDKDIERDIEP